MTPSFYNLSVNSDWTQFRGAFQADEGDRGRQVFDCFQSDAEGACGMAEALFPGAGDAVATAFDGGDLARIKAADLAHRYGHQSEHSVTTLLTESNPDVDVAEGEVEMMDLRVRGVGKGACFEEVTEYGDPIGDPFVEIGIDPAILPNPSPAERMRA